MSLEIVSMDEELGLAYVRDPAFPALGGRPMFEILPDTEFSTSVEDDWEEPGGAYRFRSEDLNIPDATVR